MKKEEKGKIQFINQQKDFRIYHETTSLIGKPYIILIVISLLIGLVVPLSIFLFVFHGDFSRNTTDWGNFGLFMEGIAGPFFSFASFFGLILTLNQSIREKKDDEAQEIFFRYIDSVIKQSEQASKDATALKSLYNRMLKPQKYAGGLPDRQDLRDIQQKNTNFLLLIYAIIHFIRSNKKLDNQTYISMLFSYLTTDEKYVFCVDMARGRADHAIAVKLQELIISTFMNVADFKTQCNVYRGSVRA